MPDWLQENLPFFILMLTVAVVRSQAIYWLGRAVPVLAQKYGKTSERIAKLDAWLNGDQVRRGTEVLERWGIIVIPLSFLTIGIQSLIQAAAGMARMRWWLYTLAAMPGVVAWAIIYGAGLSVGWHTTAAALSGNRWAITALVAFAVLIIVLRARKKNRGENEVLKQGDPPGDPA